MATKKTPANKSTSKKKVDKSNSSIKKTAKKVVKEKKVTLASNKKVNAISYQEVKIGNQIWMAKNLDVTHFRNGDPISEAKSNEEWIKAGEKKHPAWCYYDNDPMNNEKYGKLYNWYAVNDPRGLAPEGWQIPSEDDWSILKDDLGGETVAGKKMKFTDFWNDYIGKSSGNGTNESGFSGLPGGHRSTDGVFRYIGEEGYWWSSNYGGTNGAWVYSLSYGNDRLFRDGNDKLEGQSVRCLKSK